jgi:transcriptional regulator GlxA family with amidase domain
MIRDVGYSPKAFARIVRFRGAVARLYALPSEPLVQVALAAGYADQAHMTRDFAGFAGMSPAKLRGLMMSDSFKPPAHLQ